MLIWCKTRVKKIPSILQSYLHLEHTLVTEQEADIVCMSSIRVKHVAQQPYSHCWNSIPDSPSQDNMPFSVAPERSGQGPHVPRHRWHMGWLLLIHTCGWHEIKLRLWPVILIHLLVFPGSFTITHGGTGRDLDLSFEWPEASGHALLN